MSKQMIFVIGTKAELIKCMPIMLELQKQGRDYWFIHTGQHPLGEACEQFAIKKPDFVLSPEPEKNTKFWSKMNKNSIIWFFSMIFKIRNKIRKLNPKYVIYHGDTMSTAAAAIGSSRLLNLNKKWKNIHLESGLRSGNLLEPFPEEISRKISDRFSDILLAVSDLTEKNLQKYKKKKQIINMGNTILDSASIFYEKGKKKYEKNKEKYALINIHRHENLNSKKRMRKIIEILSHIKIKAIWPLHDNTKFFLEKYGLMEKINNKNIEIMPLVSYPHFIFLLANSKYIITDGGSIQEESLIFKKPCLILRKTTERQEGLKTGINFLTKLNVKDTKEMIDKIENNKIEIKDFKNPYGERGVSKRIVGMLK